MIDLGLTYLTIIYSLYPTKTLQIRQNFCPTKKLRFLISTIQ